MHRKVRNRLIVTLGIILVICSGIYISLYFLSENIVFFVKPSEITEKHIGRKIRLGGIVKDGSINKVNIAKTSFEITDGKKSMIVTYRGILPTLFRESQGIVAEGYIENNKLSASMLLTKHDENYKPPEDYLKEKQEE